MKLPALSIPTAPTMIQNTLSMVYGLSFFRTEHHESMMASIVLNTHTNMNGLSGPSQLTSEKLNIRISTPIISIDGMCLRTKKLMRLIAIAKKPKNCA
jgi:hypothetical protein